MPIGHLTLWTGGASLATLFTSMDHWSLGLRWSKNQLHCRLLKLNITRCLMLLKKRFGFALSLASYIFQSHVLFLSSVIIKRPVPCRIHLPFRLALNTSTSNIILFVIIFRLALLLLYGYRQKICQRISLQKHFLLLFFLFIVMFWVFLLLYRDILLFFSLFLSLFPSWWGCVGLRAMGSGRHVVVVTCLFVYILHFAIFPPQLSTLSPWHWGLYVSFRIYYSVVANVIH